MTSCDSVHDRLVDLIEGELAVGECRRVEAHLAQRSDRVRKVRGLRETLARLQSVSEPAVPGGFLDGFSAAVLGLLLAVGLVRTPRGPAPQPVPEILVVTGETLSIAQNLDVLESFDLLEDLDLLGRLPGIQASESERPLTVS